MPADSAYDLVLAVLSASDAFVRASQRLFRPHGLTGAQYNVLNLLAGSAGGMSQRELGDLLVVDRSNVTGLVDRLERSGWVRRAEDLRDRRAYRLMLTPAGRSAWRRALPRYRGAVEQATRGLAAAELEACARVLRRVQEGAERISPHEKQA